MDDDELEAWQLDRIQGIREKIKGMDPDRLRDYFGDVVAQIVIACADVGATDWPSNLHLGDVVEKHLMRVARAK